MTERRSTTLRHGLRRVLLSALLCALLCAPLGAVRAQEGWQSALKADPGRPAAVTGEAWLETESGASTELLVVLREQVALETVSTQTTRTPDRTAVSDALYATAQTSQQALRAWLDGRGITYRSYYIVNAMLVRGDRALLTELARRPEVGRVMTNPRVSSDLPPSTPRDLAPGPQAADAVEWGVQQIGAPQVWDLGFHGEGVVVAGQDTGYQWDHPALKAQYRGWDGVSASHDYNWHDAIHTIGGVCPPDSPVPCDDDGHGTHTMGTMVGDDGAGNQIGVAPGAEWIGCRNMLQGVGTPASYIECFEFFLAPYPVGNDTTMRDATLAPDVISNSWSCPPSEGCDADHIALLEQTVNAVRAAGILVVASAGNTGPACGTVAAPPGMYDATYTIGATDASDTIASFSSRGTTTGLTKPDITAPGVNVRSSLPGGLYGYKSGTSMASPHVAGAVALLLSARPDLRGQPAAIEALLNATAVTRTSPLCGDAAGAVPNNVYGWGRVDALTAVGSALMGTLAGHVSNQQGNALNGAVVQASSAQGDVLETLSGTEGLYSLSLVSGTYTVTASLLGYTPVISEGISVSAGTTTTLDVVLDPIADLDHRFYLPLVVICGVCDTPAVP